MKEPGPLSVEGEQAWSELLHHVEWADGFSLIVLFVEHPRLATTFGQRLRSELRAGKRALQRLVPPSADAVAEMVMAEVRSPRRSDVPLWLELHRGHGEAWESARRNILARLNEHRELLRSGHQCPVVILLPPGYNILFRDIAPDLWSIRTHTQTLRFDWVPGKAVARAGPALPEPPRELPVPDQPSIREWHRLSAKGVRELGVLRVGWRAIDDALKSGAVSFAEQTAGVVLRLARELNQEAADDPATLRALSVSLDKAGDVARMLGRPAEAKPLFRESLAIYRHLNDRAGEASGSLRAIAASLNKVGVAALDMGEWDAAQQAFEEALQTCRGLQEQNGGGVEELRPLVGSLYNLGHLAMVRGQWESGYLNFKQALQVLRSFSAQLGDGPAKFHDLSLTLSEFGNAARIVGKWSEARGALQEAIDIRRELVARYNRSPEQLRALAVALTHLGNLASAEGAAGEARQAYEDALAVNRELSHQLRGSPPGLRDLSVALSNVGDAAFARGDLSKAQACYEEALQIDRELNRRLGGAPQSLRDLSVSLSSLGDLAFVKEEWQEAERVYQESLAIREDLHHRYGGTPQNQLDLEHVRDRLELLAEKRNQLGRSTDPPTDQEDDDTGMKM